MQPTIAMHDHKAPNAFKPHFRPHKLSNDHQTMTQRYSNIQEIGSLKYFPQVEEKRPKKHRRANSLGLTPREPISLNYLKFYKQAIPVKVLSETDRIALLDEILKLDYEFFLSKFSVEVGNRALRSKLMRPQEVKRSVLESLSSAQTGVSDPSTKLV